MGESSNNVDDGSDKLSPQQEETLLEEMLRHQVGLDPQRLGGVLDLAAVGIVNEAWRNGPIEDCHSSGGLLSDGAMLRINAHTTWRVRGIMRRWRAEQGLTARSASSRLNSLTLDVIGSLAFRIFRWLVMPTRRLPIDLTVADIAGDDLEEVSQYANRVLGGFVATAEHRSARYVFWRAAAHGGLACPHWWGTPTWPELVNRFLQALEQPNHPHWGEDGQWRTRLPPEPVQIANRNTLRQLLLRHPWDLDADSAQWLVNAGIGYLLPLSSPLSADRVHGG